MISFIVPSLRDRRDDLLKCLAALSRETRGIPSEALVVVEDDQAAAGLAALSTADLDVRPVIGPGSCPVRRNAGFRAMRGDTVCLLDDDAEPMPGYGAAAAALFADGRDRVVQGALWPAWDVEPPAELLPQLFRVGGFNRLGDERRLDVFIGANAAFPRRVLDRVGPFNEDFGPGGRVVPWGDDTEWQRRSAALGFPLEHDDRLAVRHRIQAERITVEAVLRRAERVGRTRARIEWNGRRPGLAVLAKQRALAAWARTKGAGIEARCLARRLAGYADELARIRGG